MTNPTPSELAERFQLPEEAALYALDLAQSHPDLVVSLAAGIQNAKRKTKAGGHNGGRPAKKKDPTAEIS